jgi:hypothetical protein
MTTTPTQTIINIKRLRKAGKGYKVAETSTATLDLDPQWFHDVVNAGEWVTGEVPETHESYSFDGVQTFTYIHHDEETFNHREWWVNHYLTGDIPSPEETAARTELDKEISTFMGLGENPTEGQLVAVAKDPSTTSQMLAWLATSRHESVGFAVIDNPKTSLDTLLVMLESLHHNGLNFWNYFYDGITEKAFEAVEERYPEHEWEDEDFDDDDDIED